MSVVSAFQSIQLLPRLPSRRQRGKSPRCTLMSAGSQSKDAPDEPNIVFLMRHGMTDWNLLKRVQGSLDESRLNSAGINQARTAGEYLRHIPFDRVYCSPLTRARHTVQLLAEASANPTLVNRDPTVLENFAEMTFPWQGLFRDMLSTGQWADHFHHFHSNPRAYQYNGFNPVLDMEQRAQAVLQTIYTQRPKHALLVGHNQANKAFISAALNMRSEFDSWIQGNCCVNVFELYPNRPPVLRLCNGLLSTTTLKLMHRHAFRRPRPGYVRVLLVATNSLTSPHVVEHLHANQVKYVYALKTMGTPSPIVDTPNDGIEFKWVTIPPEYSDRIVLYESAVRFVNFARGKHANGSIAIVAETCTQVAIFFAAILQTGITGSHRFRCDVDGITVVDITVRYYTITRVIPRVLYFNMLPLSEDTLLRYTSLMHLTHDRME